LPWLDAKSNIVGMASSFKTDLRSPWKKKKKWVLYMRNGVGAGTEAIRLLLGNDLIKCK